MISEQEIVKICRMVDCNCIPWKTDETTPIHLPPDSILRIHYYPCKTIKNCDIIFFNDLNSFRKEMQDLNVIPFLEPYGKICVNIKPEERNLLLPTYKKIPNGNLIQLINEKQISENLVCVFRSPRKMKAPIWNKKDDGTILVYSNLGFGDDFFSARYPLILKDKNKSFIFEARIEEASFMRECSFYDDVVVKGEPLPLHDYCIEISELFNHRNCIFPYFKKPLIKDVLPECKKIKVGFIADGHYVKIGQKRSLSIDLLKSFPDFIQFYFVQKKDNRETIYKLPSNVIDLSPKLNCWLDTACYLHQMDFFISVDTGIVHLAAGMGVNVKVLLQPEHEHFYIRKNEKFSSLYQKNLMAYWGDPNLTINKAIKDMIGIKLL